MHWLIAILFLVLSPAHAAPPNHGSKNSQIKMGQLYQKAQSLLAAGKCEQVLVLETKIPLSEPVDDVKMLAQVEAIIARCYFQLGKIEGAEGQLRNILFIQPTFEFDPFDTPSPLIDMFNKIKRELSEKALELKTAKENASKQNDILETEITVRKMSPLAAFVPFGFPQFEYGATTKGIIVAALEATFLSVNIGSFWYKRSLTSADSSNLVANSDVLSAYNIAQGIQFSAIGAFAAVYLFSLVDGLMHRDKVIEETSHSINRKISREEFIQKLNSLKATENSQIFNKD